jgi:hypothetical protein
MKLLNVLVLIPTLTMNKNQMGLEINLDLKIARNMKNKVKIRNLCSKISQMNLNKIKSQVITIQLFLQNKR